MAMRWVLVALMGSLIACAFLAGCTEPSPEAGTIRITIDYTSAHEEDLWVRGTVTLPKGDPQWPWASYACGGEGMTPLPGFGRAHMNCDVPLPTQPFPPSAAQPEDAFVAIEVTVSTEADHLEGYDGTNAVVREAPEEQGHLRFQATVAADGIINLRQL